MRKIKFNSKYYQVVKRLVMMSIIGTSFFGNGSIVAAEDVEPAESSNNEVVVNNVNYSITTNNPVASDTTTTDNSGDLNIVYGGGNEENSSDANDNRVTINGRTIYAVFGGASSTGNVSGNTVIINNGTVTGVMGGFTFIPYDSSRAVGDVTNNHVIINGGTIGAVSGGEIGIGYAEGDEDIMSNISSSAVGNVMNNVVDINGGTITNGVIGGASLYGRATGNTININGGKISGDIIGGWARLSDSELNAQNNTININGSPDLSDANLIGGMIGSGSDRTYVSTGNKLNINTSGITLGNINGFSDLNFYFGEGVKNGDTIVTLTNTSGSNFSGVSNMSFAAHGDTQLKNNDKITLITNQNNISLTSNGALATRADEGDDSSARSLGNINYNGKLSRGISELYDIDVAMSPDSRSIVATVGEGRKNPQIDPLPAPYTEPVHIMQNHIPEIPPDTSAADIMQVYVPHGYEIFFNSGGGHFKIKTGHGSTLTSNVGNYDLGFARNFKTNSGMFVLAPIFEYGHGSFDSYFTKDLAGYGHSYYTAGGVIARIINDSGFYYEGSFRGGRSRTEFASDDFLIAGVRSHINYNIESPVFMGHVRVGNQKRLGKNNLLDVYGIYSYARQNSANTTISSGENYNFSSVDSIRFRAGYRLTTRTSDISRIYTGLVYQYDSSADSTATGRGITAHQSGLSGSSGMLELGWQLRAFPYNPWMVDFNTSGWVGLQKGFTAMAKLKKDF